MLGNIIAAWLLGTAGRGRGGRMPTRLELLSAPLFVAIILVALFHH